MTRRWVSAALLLAAGLGIAAAVTSRRGPGPPSSATEGGPSDLAGRGSARTIAPAEAAATDGGHQGTAEAASESPRRPDGLAPLSTADVERLLAETGKRGERLLLDDPAARSAHARIQVEGDSAWEALLRALHSPDREMRIGAAAVLLVHARPEVGRPLADALEKERDPVARRVLVEALAGSESPDGANALLRVWQDRAAPEELRSPALAGLAALGHAEARAAVYDGRTPAPARQLAEHGLVRAYQRDGDVAGLLEVVRWISTSSPDAPSRAAAKEALGERSH